MGASFTKKNQDLFDFHEHNLGPKGEKNLPCCIVASYSSVTAASVAVMNSSFCLISPHLHITTYHCTWLAKATKKSGYKNPSKYKCWKLY